jgi:23S rRNA (adenine2503-C2)-methyltransferase
MEATTRALFGQTKEDLAAVMKALGEPAYRATQLVDALYKLRVEGLEEITTLPEALRGRMASEGYVVGLPKIAQVFTSVDGTERFLVEMADGQTVETVWMPDGDGGERGDGSEAAKEEEDEDASRAERFKRATICVSSQVGCAVNCRFCLTAKLGLTRNLTAGEIAGQVVAALNRHKVELQSRRASRPERINLVFMGMGEPFLNYDEFFKAVRLLVQHVGVPESRMTVSTSGIVPAIRDYAKETVRPKLAVSLNASNSAVRREVMPVTKKWDIPELMAALKEIPLRTREAVTFEYVLLGGVNDQPEHARELLAMLREHKLRAKVNLIAWNPGPGIEYIQPKQADVDAFQRMLIDAGVRTYVRRPRGRDIYAACGQLKRTVGQEPLVAIQ